MSVARHPITGSPIQIIRSEAHISRDQKTLVHLTQNAEVSNRWTRWQTIISDKETLAVLDPVKPNYLLLWNVLSPEDVVFWTNWLKVNSKAIHILFISAAIAGQLPEEVLHSVNIICYNEMYDLYPFIEVELQNDSPILQIVTAIATVFRYNRLVIDSTLPYNRQVEESARIYEKQEGTILRAPLKVELVPKFVLIQQYFQHPLARRSRELKECLLRNIKNPFIDEIHLLNEISYPEWLKYPKIKERVIINRLSFDAVLMHIKEQIPPNTIVAFSNTDIYFDGTIKHLYSIDLEKKFLSLLRWDDPNLPQIQSEDERQPAKIFGPRPDSQDTWILKSDDITFNPQIPDFQIQFGKPGCDNALNVAMLKQKFLIANPAYTIKTYHIHLSAIRDYNPQDIIEKPMYLYIDPTALQEYKTVRALEKYKITSAPVPASSARVQQNITVKRQIKYVNENAAATICSMLKRGKVWNYAIKEDNEYVYPEQITKTIYHLKNKFMSASGLFYGMKDIYIGKNQQWQDGWEANNTNILATTLFVPSLLAIEMSKDAGTNIPLWCLHYLSKVLDIRPQIQQKTGISPEFLVCQKNEMGDFLGMLEWSQPTGTKVNLVPWDDKLQYYSENLFPVEPTKKLVSPKDIANLRELIPAFLKDTTHEKPTVVFCIEEDEQILSRAWFERIQAITFAGWRVHRIGAKTSPKNVLQVISQADLLIGQADSKWSALSWMWCLKPQASVIEVMRDTVPTGENIHLAGVSSLQYILVVAKREPLDLQREHAANDINTATKNFCYEKAISAAVPKELKPTIILPQAQTGLHAHSGDTFREMVEIWAERGYIQLQRSSTTPFVWLNNIGGTLLYDRPTLKWLEPNLLYDFAFFGNPTPPAPANKSSTWTFWPRSPRKIEEFVKQHIPTYEERTTETIFLGKVENGVQMKNRPLSWQPAIQKWSMPLDSTGQAYPFTQDEYLQEISKARFGLCLAGYGNKCNRDIEYFATGTVPICSPEVDMKYYLNPPKEGVHYLRVTAPEDIKPLIEKISTEAWQKMSKACRDWWLENASAEGMFRLTMAAVANKSRITQLA